MTRDEQRLAQVLPDLADRVRRVLAAMAALGFPMTVTAGLRTTAQQQALYAQGRTVPGRVVTQADGVTVRSKHQEGRAVDCAFLVDGRPSWNDALPWGTYGSCAQAVGLTWGGTWRSFPDRPHVEWNGPVSDVMTRNV